MNKFRTSFAILIFAFSLYSCQQDNSDNPTTTPDIIPTKVEARFNGIVQDINGTALENATVMLGGQSVQTDENGYFNISSQVNSSGAYLKVQSSGYYDGYGTILPSKQGDNYTLFQLKPRGLGIMIESDNPIEVGQDNNKVLFQANSFTDKNGVAYNGDITVYMDYIDPSAENFGNVMPGDMSAINASDESGILKSFGMLNVELFGSNGQELDVNEPAQIQIGIPSDFISDAPSEIPMWYFDTETGIWIEDGAASKVGNHYEATVTHFTLWNCDDFLGQPIILSGRVISRSPLSNFKVRVTWVSLNDTRMVHTDSEGYFSGIAPSDETFLIEILDHCNNVIEDLTVGPLYEDQFYEIYVDPNAYNNVLVEGKLKDCDNNNVDNGYALIKIGNESKLASANDQGDFSTNFINCDDQVELEVTGIDLDDNVKGNEINFDITNNEVQCGDVVACGAGNIDIGLTATLDDGTFIHIPHVTASDTDSISSNGGSQYAITFKAIEELADGGSINYTIYAFDISTDPNVESWVLLTERSFSNTNETGYWFFGIQTGNVTITETNEYFEFKGDNVELSRKPENETFYSNDFVMRGLK